MVVFFNFKDVLNAHIPVIHSTVMPLPSYYMYYKVSSSSLFCMYFTNAAIGCRLPTWLNSNSILSCSPMTDQCNIVSTVRVTFSYNYTETSSSWRLSRCSYLLHHAHDVGTFTNSPDKTFTEKRSALLYCLPTKTKGSTIV